jgi:hypothetical protein
MTQQRPIRTALARTIRGLLTPETVTPPRPAGPAAKESIVRSYLLMRVIVGALGVLLPVGLLLGDWLFLGGNVSLRGSLSAYYYSGMRDFFVGTLMIIGMFLVAYKFFEANLDNLVSILAGIAAMLVAFFPTHGPSQLHYVITPIQDSLGEGTVSRIHYVAAGTFMGGLAAISFCFGLREGRRHRTIFLSRFHLDHAPVIRRAIHWICAGAIVVAMLYMLAEHWLDWLDLNGQTVLVGEIVCGVAFGLSWFYKGFELDTLRGTPSPDVPEIPAAAGLSASGPEPSRARQQSV